MFPKMFAYSLLFMPLSVKVWESINHSSPHLKNETSKHKHNKAIYENIIKHTDDNTYTHQSINMTKHKHNTTSTQQNIDITEHKHDKT